MAGLPASSANVFVVPGAFSASAASLGVLVWKSPFAASSTQLPSPDMLLPSETMLPVFRTQPCPWLPGITMLLRS